MWAYHTLLVASVARLSDPWGMHLDAPGDGPCRSGEREPTGGFVPLESDRSGGSAAARTNRNRGTLTKLTPPYGCRRRPRRRRARRAACSDDDGDSASPSASTSVVVSETSRQQPMSHHRHRRVNQPRRIGSQRRCVRQRERHRRRVRVEDGRGGLGNRGDDHGALGP